ncbi:heme-binding protein [Pikeienuella piscinae]|uniref:Heme-binding protein n=1 Tax=Pikeienuella piscinae TaxID=2748098 RepID=A0A7L5BXY5_9RHOB|nr:heme-binding protein [Pikeienuella piscinae]QIE56785.1 heme-binding protein [Pikeienuella piscinae]
MTLTLDTARAIIRNVFAEGAARGCKPLSVVVLDGGGHVIAFERSDGGSPMRFAIAHGKAHGAVMMGIGSRALFQRAEAQPYFIQAMNTLTDGALVPVPGGVLVRSNDAIIGAVGVTGDTSDADEACAVAAITAAGFTPDPGGAPA